MPAFPSYPYAVDVSFLLPYAPHIDEAATGRITTQSGIAIGFIWDQTWGEEYTTTVEFQGFLAKMRKYWNQSIELQLKHRFSPGSGLPPNGAGGGNPVVMGANQSGEILRTNGWTPNVENIVRGGDFVRLSNFRPMLSIVEDANSDANGNVDLSIFPSISDGVSPINGAPIQREDCEFNVIITKLSVPRANRDWSGPFTIEFAELI